jgi:cyclopropane fatty-acyl-phospholipid synthase-like methyltransferase
MLPLLSTWADQVIAIEPDPSRFTQACETVRRTRMLGNVTVVNGTLLDAGMEKASADALVCAHVLEHLCCDDIEPLLSSVSEILRTDGLFILLTTHSKRWSDRFRNVRIEGPEVTWQDLTLQQFDDIARSSSQSLPVRLFAMRTIKHLLKCRFAIEETYVFNEFSKSFLMDVLGFRDRLINACLLKAVMGNDVLVISKRL